MDHVRPRVEVTRWVEDTEEMGPRQRVIHRQMLPKPALRPAYYWLAYEPANLAWSCERCNTGWKRTFFPVEPARGPFKAPSFGSPEQALLLDPFEYGFDPLCHFEFEFWGGIFARTGDERAQATIAVCGLDRQSLCEERERIAKGLNLDLRALRRALRDPEENDEVRGQQARLAQACAWSTPPCLLHQGRSAPGPQPSRPGMGSARACCGRAPT